MSERVPVEVLDLVRFLAQTWDVVDHFVYEHCDGEALMKYPVVQGTRNQINLRRMGEQGFDPENIHKAVKFMLSSTD